MRPRSLGGGEDEKDTQGTKPEKYEMVEVLVCHKINERIWGNLIKMWSFKHCNKLHKLII